MNSPQSVWTLSDWLAWLETLSPREIDLGLERVAAVLERLSLARPELVLTVAGTNGKGSCAAMLDSLLREGGRRTGCYTSPHVLRYNERIRVDGRAVDDAAILEAFRAVEERRDGVPLTYFEYGTLAALVAFERAGADHWVLEVGLGGRLDAVNAVDPDGVIITNVTLEHRDWLGDTVEAIAREKAGVMRPDRPAVFGAPAVPATIESEAQRLGADLRLPGRDFSYEATKRGWRWRGRQAALDDLGRPSLHGAFQLQNASAVLALVEACGLDALLRKELVDAAFSRLEIPGRFQRVSAGHEWLLDVAHNPDAARVLGESLAEMPKPGGVTALVGMLSDKDVAGIVGPLAPQVDRWVAVTADHPRARPARTLAQSIAQLTGKPCLVGDEVASGMALLDERAARDELLLVTGSFYTVGPALAWLTAV